METKKFFVGRKKEIELLNTYLEQASNNQGVVIGVSGPAGVGKSSLLRFFLENLNDSGKTEILVGRCLDTDEMPFLPFTEALRKYFKVTGVDQSTAIEKLKEGFTTVGKDLLGVIPIVGPFLTIGISVTDYISKNLSSTPKEIEQEKLFYAVTKILLGVARKKRVVLVIEDLHLADKSSLNLLQYIARECTENPILIIVTFRDLDSNKKNDFSLTHRRLTQQNLIKLISLDDFDRTEIDMYFETIFARTVDDKIKTILYKQTHGNPFYLSQIIPVLLQEKLITIIDEKWVLREGDLSLNLPQTVEATVNEILESLAPQELKTLQTAAAIGDIFEYKVLASASTLQPDQIDEQIDALDNKKIITEIPEVIDAYTFIHSIVRNVVYQKLANRERRRLHFNIAQAIEKFYQAALSSVVEKLAYHYERAGELEKTIEYSLLSARKAEFLLAYDNALNFYKLALKSMGEYDERLSEILLRAGEIADYSSQWTLARELYDKLYSIASAKSSERGIMQATRGLASINFREGKWDDAEKLSLEHLRLAEKINDLSEKSIGLFNLGQIFWRTGRWQHAEDALKSALSIQEEKSWFERMMPTIAILGVVHRNQDEYEQALDTYAKGIEIHSREKVADQYWLGIIYNNMGTALRSIAAEDDMKNPDESSYWQKSIDAYEKSLSITVKLKSLRDIGNTFNNLAIIYKSKKKNNLNKAIEFALKAKTNLEQIDAPVDMLDNLRITGAIYGQSSQYSLAIRTLEQSLSIAHNIKAKDKIGLANMEIGTVHHKMGDMDSADYYYKEALSIFSELGAPKRIKYINYLREMVAQNQDAPISNPE